MFGTTRRCHERASEVTCQTSHCGSGAEKTTAVSSTRSSNSGSRSANQLRDRIRWASTTAPGATQGTLARTRRRRRHRRDRREARPRDRRRGRHAREREAEPGAPDLVVHPTDRKARPVVAVAARLPVVAPVAPEREADVGARRDRDASSRPRRDDVPANAGGEGNDRERVGARHDRRAEKRTGVTRKVPRSRPGRAEVERRPATRRCRARTTPGAAPRSAAASTRLDRNRVAALPVARAPEDHRDDATSSVDHRPAALPRANGAAQRDDDARTRTSAVGVGREHRPRGSRGSGSCGQRPVFRVAEQRDRLRAIVARAGRQAPSRRGREPA